MVNEPKSTLRAAAAALALALAAACAHTNAASTTATYTSAQAAAGDRAYQSACVVCHGSDLGGGAQGPPLAGPAFARRWHGRPVGELTVFMREHMPRTLPGLLNDRTYLALVAHLLAENGVPAGDAPLALDAAWPIAIGSR